MEIQLTESEETMIEGFLEAFFFADTGEDGQPDDDATVSEECQRKVSIDCMAFAQRVAVYVEGDNVSADWEQVGMDFYYTRQGHGVGFWDRPELYGPYGDMFTKISESFGAVDLYQGDDGLIYS